MKVHEGRMRDERRAALMAEWYASYYRDQYADSVRGLLTPERSRAEVDFILRQTALTAPAAIADIACGTGRHACIFAERGFRVTGIDLNEKFIAEARQQTGTQHPGTFLVGDMREPLGGPYRLVMLLFQSFGYFSDEDNARVLRGWCMRLEPDGYLVLDVWNRDFILRHYVPEHTWDASENLRVTERRSFDPLTGRLTVDYTYMYADGREYQYQARFRLYTPTELRDLCASAGVVVAGVFGSLTGDPFSLDARRLVIFARRRVRRRDQPLARARGRSSLIAEVDEQSPDQVE